MSLRNHLAVCSWSLQPQSSQDLIAKLKEIGLSRIQLHLNPLHDAAQAWSDTAPAFARDSIEVVSGMITMEGEDYSSLEAIHRTGGVVPDATWEKNWRDAQAAAEHAARFGLRLVTFHAGFIPPDRSDPIRGKLKERLRKLADLFSGRDIDLGFETGQETAETLKEFLIELERPSVGVNFDPANMLIYNMGDPVTALRTLAPWLKQIHIKDAVRPAQRGTMGSEKLVGTGEVDWPAFFQAVRDLGFAGSFAIEREHGSQRVADIRTAADFVLSRFEA